MSGSCLTCGGGYPVTGGYYCPLCDGGSENVDMDLPPRVVSPEPTGDSDSKLSAKQETRRAARLRRKERKRLAAEQGSPNADVEVQVLWTMGRRMHAEKTYQVLDNATPERHIRCYSPFCLKEAGAGCDVCVRPICEDHGEVWTELLNPSGAVEAYVVSTRHTDSLRALLAKGASGKIKIVCAGRQECRLPLPRAGDGRRSSADKFGDPFCKQ